MKKRTLGYFLVGILLACVAHGHDGSHASVHDTVAGIIARMQKLLSQDQLVQLTPAQVEKFLTDEERQVLGSGHIRFNVNVPVVVTILRDTSLGEEPFWLRGRNFVPTGTKVRLGNTEWDLWEHTFPAGEIGLGVHNFTGRGTHYLPLIRPEASGRNLKVSRLYPGHLRTAPFVAGVEPFLDQDVKLRAVPASLEGQLLLQTQTDSEEDARLVSLFARTQFPASSRPDHVVLTWSEDPRKTQTIQWRTSSSITRGMVRYQPRQECLQDAILDWTHARMKRATSRWLATPTLLNDPLVRRHTVVLSGLKPGTTYVYSVGDGSEAGWTKPAEFTTAPAEVAPFSFVYLGDAQNGLDRWGVLLHNAFQKRPDAAFYLMAGDLVNRGAERWDWDSFFEYSKGVFDRRQLVPVLGNHEYQGGREPALYLAQFELLRNGPAGFPAERAYSFEYSNAKFIILDSNLAPAKQTAWLEKQLAQTKALWKFVSYHHPAYSSGGNRDNPEIREFWTPLFDKYHVDLALQGHDHAYLRTYPMRDDKRVARAQDGTIYIISVSGTKFYEQGQHDYTEVGLTKVATYQVLDIQVVGNRLTYRAHDADGTVKDEFVIEK